MPLRSDFDIQAVTPEPPKKQHKPTPVHWRGVVSEAHDGDVAVSQELWAPHLPEIDVGEPSRAEAAPQGEPVRRVAFLIVHGMGQQVPFETLSVLGQALITKDEERERKCGEPRPARTAADPAVSVRRVKLTQEDGAPDLSRVEVQFRHEKPVDVHLYESYWAPLTEGQISFLQTVKFLYLAAWNGMLTYFRIRHRKSCDPSQPAPPEPKDRQRHFDRWMFGRFHDMPISRATFWTLLGMVLLISLLLIPALLAFTPTGVSLLQRFGLWLWHGTLHWRWWWRCALGLLVVLFLAAAWWTRYFVVEYVGDVAIYVSSYKVSRFQGIRDQIQQAVRAVAHEIYAAGLVDKSHPPYDEVVIVGHSLGSVIAYDALNEAINWDEVECAFRRRVVPRTTRLITFGSPLDKTAFLFRTQVSSARNLREALAARQQPLILNYARYRPKKTFSWINIWSSRDIISGHLDYYDIPKDEANGDPAYNAVENRPDPQARLPLLAHMQYWENEALHKALYEAMLATV